MATAEVLLPEIAASSVDQGNSFIFDATSNSVQALQNSTSSVPVEVQKKYFCLNSQSFIDLQVYLKDARKLPSSQKDFEAAYPRALFAPYMAKDKDQPDLYDTMCITLVDINNRCWKFSRKTMEPMVSLAGDIANFAETAAHTSRELHRHLDYIYASDLPISDPSMKAWVTGVQDICGEFIKQANKNQTKCETFGDKLIDFKLDTEQDITRLRDVNTRSDRVLPTTADVNEEIRQGMDLITAELRKLVERQNAAIDRASNSSGIRWYCFVPMAGVSFMTEDPDTKEGAEKAAEKIAQVYNRIINEAGPAMATAISFRSICANLIGTIDTVYDSIQKAEEAVQHMIGAFDALRSGLVGVAEGLDNMKGYVEKGSRLRLMKAYDHLEQAGARWESVVELARDFQARGLLMDANIKSKVLPVEPPRGLEILSANFGGSDCTKYAQVVFNTGENLSINSANTGLPDPWRFTAKSISVLHSWGAGRRIFVCAEWTGNHLLKAKPISESRIVNSVLNELKPFAKPADVEAEILSIVWGKAEVLDKNVYDYCYQQMRTSQPIRWANETMGGDTWLGTLKSGTIYFTVNGGTTIKQCSGRENSETRWDL